MSHQFSAGRKRVVGVTIACVLAVIAGVIVVTTRQPAPSAASDTAVCDGSNVVLTAGSSAVPYNLCVPAAATDDSSTLLVWNKPDVLAGVVDFAVYQDGRAIGTAEKNATAAAPYITAFRGMSTDGFNVSTLAHSFQVTGLKETTTYSFQIAAVYADGHQSALSAPTVVTTKATSQTTVVTDSPSKAVGDGVTDDTQALQKAIDSCQASGCTVVVPKGTYLTGALFLHSDMTLKLAAGARIVGSTDPAAYPLSKGYGTDSPRPPSLINVLPAANGQGATNVRIVGPGTIDGSGWKTSGTATDEAGVTTAQYIASNVANVAKDGILAANQVAWAEANAASLPGSVNGSADVASAVYGAYRSSLMTFVGVDGLFLEGFTLTNPAFHGIVVTNSHNTTVSSTSLYTYDANNGDGLDLSGTQSGIVVGNVFNTGDDQVDFGAGQGAKGAQGRTASDVWVFGNYFRQGHGGVAVGSSTAAWVQRILAEDNIFYKNEYGALRLKSTSDMNGGGRDIVFRDSAVACSVRSAFIATLSYSQAPAGYTAGDSATFQNITVRNVSVDANSSTSCAMPTTTSNAVIEVDAGPTINPKAATVGPFVFDGLRLRNVNPTHLQGLTGSTFGNVCFVSVDKNSNPWVLDGYSTGNTWSGSTPMPGQAWPWPACWPT